MRGTNGPPAREIGKLAPQCNGLPHHEPFALFFNNLAKVQLKSMNLAPTSNMSRAKARLSHFRVTFCVPVWRPDGQTGCW